MKHLKLITALFLFSALSANAQEPERKKETKSGTSQERAINEKGIAVKSSPKSKKSSQKTQPAPAPSTGTTTAETKKKD